MVLDGIRINEQILKNSKSPHQRDLARMRLNILKSKRDKIKAEWQERTTHGKKQNILR